MAPSDFAKADIPSIVEKLTVEEAIALIAGVGFWHTHAVDRLGIPAVKVCLQAKSGMPSSDQHIHRSAMVRMVSVDTGIYIIKMEVLNKLSRRQR